MKNKLYGIWALVFALLLISGDAWGQSRAVLGESAAGKIIAPRQRDSDLDGLPDRSDDCPNVSYWPGFDGTVCGPMDLDPLNDPQPECKARERVARFLINDPTFITHIAFSIVKDGQLHFADSFEYVGGGQFVHDPDGIYRLFKIGSTSKSIVATTAKIMEHGSLTIQDFEHLHPDISRRSLQRDLKAMVDRGLVVAEGETHNLLYRLVVPD